MADLTKKKVKQKKSAYYDTSGELKRNKKFCPKCGPGVFLAEHRDRRHCGKCGYTEKEGIKKTEEKKDIPKTE